MYGDVDYVISLIKVGIYDLIWWVSILKLSKISMQFALVTRTMPKFNRTITIFYERNCEGFIAIIISCPWVTIVLVRRLNVLARAWNGLRFYNEMLLCQ